MTPETYQKLNEMDAALVVGMRVKVRWGYGLGFRAQGIGTITKIFPKSVRVKLTEPTSPIADNALGWPAGFELKGIPRISNFSAWDTWNSVEPIGDPS